MRGATGKSWTASNNSVCSAVSELLRLAGTFKEVVRIVTFNSPDGRRISILVPCPRMRYLVKESFRDLWTYKRKGKFRCAVTFMRLAFAKKAALMHSVDVFHRLTFLRRR